jgi:hypothetical protein
MPWRLKIDDLGSAARLRRGGASVPERDQDVTMARNERVGAAVLQVALSPSWRTSSSELSYS